MLGTRTSHQLLRLLPSPIFIEFFLKTPSIGKSWNRKRIRIKFRGFQTLLSESLFYSKLMTRWTFDPYKYSLSIFQQCKVILFESLRSSCRIKFWLFSTKIDDFYFKSKKKFPNGTGLLDGWIFRVLPTYLLLNVVKERLLIQHYINLKLSESEKKASWKETKTQVESL